MKLHRDESQLRRSDRMQDSDAELFVRQTEDHALPARQVLIEQQQESPERTPALVFIP